MNDTIDRTEETLTRVLTIGSRASTAILAAGLVMAVFSPSSEMALRLFTIGLGLPVNAQYLVHPAGRVGVRKIERFREWLHEELAADRDMMPPQVWEPL